MSFQSNDATRYHELENVREEMREIRRNLSELAKELQAQTNAASSTDNYYHSSQDLDKDSSNYRSGRK